MHRPYTVTIKGNSIKVALPLTRILARSDLRQVGLID